jgi:hypothetical protein
MNDKERRAKNFEIARQEIELFDAMPDIGTVSTRRIKINRRTSEHPEISSGRAYLCLIYGLWYVGRFSRQHYGWNFNNWGTSGIQLDSIHQVYEIELPNIPSELIPRIHKEEKSEWDD